MSTKDKHRLVLTIPHELVDMIDDFRAGHRPVPSRHAAIVALILAGLRPWYRENFESLGPIEDLSDTGKDVPNGG